MSAAKATEKTLQTSPKRKGEGATQKCTRSRGRKKQADKKTHARIAKCNGGGTKAKEINGQSEKKKEREGTERRVDGDECKRKNRK
jgi:hypothetical protein